jgi:DNA polymerase I-like protein with 3'-5' exonuclease and polymerase domains
MAEHKIIRTQAGMAELQAYLSDKTFIAYDVETTGLDRESEIIGFSVCADPEQAFYVILSEYLIEEVNTACPECRGTGFSINAESSDAPCEPCKGVGSSTERRGALHYLETKDAAKGFIETLVGRSLVMHNAIYDCMLTNAYLGVSLIDSVHTDTMVLAHLLDENRPVGLKELGVSIFGEDAKKEQTEMKASVSKNGGSLTKGNYELYKADSELIARYGAQDAALTISLFYLFVEQLYEQKLDKFFYEDESMPLLRGPTYELNTVGLKVDPVKLQELKATLEAECAQAHAFILSEISAHVKDKYPGTNKSNHFNIGAGQQVAWLLFEKLGHTFHVLTKEGKELCKALDLKPPYSNKAKAEFIAVVRQNHGRVYAASTVDKKTGKAKRPKKVGEYWKYLGSGKDTLATFANRYKWVAKLLEYKKNSKLLETYVEGIQNRMKYGVIRPSFKQHGTTSGRYSSSNPNFQNLPRDDKRVKACMVARHGKVFVGADQSQLEPRVFASYSGDVRLQKCFTDGDDFYSVIGMETFDKHGLSLKKSDPNGFAKKYPQLRDISKVVGLSATYGTTAFKMAPTIGKSIDDTQAVIDTYFDRFPDVKAFQLRCHNQAKTHGVVYNLFGRPRRIPEAMTIPRIYGNLEHAALPYTARNILNLAVNHPIQSTGSSIMNRASIMFHALCREMAREDPRWLEVFLVLQCHDELIAEAPEAIAEDVAVLMKHAMETAVILPGVALEAEPKIAKNLAELK